MRRSRIRLPWDVAACSLSEIFMSNTYKGREELARWGQLVTLVVSDGLWNTKRWAWGHRQQCTHETSVPYTSTVDHWR